MASLCNSERVFVFLVQLLSVERLNLYAASLRVCFLLFESMREHLKFQLEVSFLSMAGCLVIVYWASAVRCSLNINLPLYK